jgi:acetoacetate decarboxylase
MTADDILALPSFPGINAPVADFPVRRVTEAHHFIAGLTLPYGRVLYDYVAEAAKAKAAA